MNIGDKVRLLHGTEEGVVRKIIDNRTVEIEIEDGFLIPVLKKEVVLISSDEDNKPASQNLHPNIGVEKNNLKDDKHQEGIYLGITFNQNLGSGWVINNTKDIVLFAVYEKRVEGIFGLSHGVLNRHTYAKIADWNSTAPQRLPYVIIDIIKFTGLTQEHNEPYTREIDLGSFISQSKLTQLPFLNATGKLIALNDQMIIPEPEVIKEAFFSGEPEIRNKDKVKKDKVREVDLHIEALTDDYLFLDNQEILDLQMSEFNTSLENAVVDGADEIIFIHGIGNGVLRNKIHKKLSQYPHIKYFEDARKEKFGYGATKVHLK